MANIVYQTNIAPYIDIIKRRKYFLIIPIVLSCIIGSVIAYKLPSIYRSGAKLFYITPQIPEEMLTSFVNIYLETAIIYIEASGFSRERCTQIINEINLYPDLVNELPVDDVITHMRENYTRENLYESVAKGGQRSEEVIIGFGFSFDDKTPQKAFDVANIIASDFVTNYKNFREGFASVSSTFFADEQQRLKAEIAKIDKAIADFKEKHVNELPELFQNNYQMVQTLNQQILTLDQEERFLNEKKIMLVSQLSTVDPLIPLEGISGQKIVTPEEKLANLKTELALLQAIVSEKHPDVIRVRREIEELEKIVPQDKDYMDIETERMASENYWARKLNFKAQAAYNPTYVNFVSQLEETEAQIESLHSRKDKYKEDMDKYMQRLEKTPVVEQEYVLLVRDRESAQRRYDQLVNQALQADSSQVMEKKEIGGKLIIVEPPNFPLRPVKPNRPYIVAVALLIGAGVSALLVFMSEFLFQTIRTHQDLTKITSIPVLSELPDITIKQKVGRAQIKRIAIPVVIIIIVPIIIFAIGMLYRPLELDVTFINLFNILKKKITLLGL